MDRTSGTFSRRDKGRNNSGLNSCLDFTLVLGFGMPTVSQFAVRTPKTLHIVLFHFIHRDIPVLIGQYIVDRLNTAFY